MRWRQSVSATGGASTPRARQVTSSTRPARRRPENGHRACSLKEAPAVESRSSSGIVDRSSDQLVHRTVALRWGARDELAVRDRPSRQRQRTVRLIMQSARERADTGHVAQVRPAAPTALDRDGCGNTPPWSSAVGNCPGERQARPRVPTSPYSSISFTWRLSSRDHSICGPAGIPRRTGPLFRRTDHPGRT